MTDSSLLGVLARAVALTGVVTLASGQTHERPAWRDVELPTGFHLDLATGEVSSRVNPDSLGSVTWIDGRLLATPRLARWDGSGAERVSTRVIRRGGRPLDDRRAGATSLESDDELLFDLAPGIWGYLRVLRMGEAGVTLEYARGTAEGDVLERDPPRLEANTDGTHSSLRWNAVPNATYLVERRVLGDGGVSAETSTTLVEGGSWVDPELPGSALLEYRVWRSGDAAAFGSRVRQVLVEHPGEWTQTLIKGMRIDLLTGEVGGPGADVEVIYATPPSVALRPLDGTRIAMPDPRESRPTWVLPEARGGRYEVRVRTVMVDTKLAIQLRQGVYGRLTFLVEGGSVSLLRQFDLYGGRLLTAAPELTSTHWTRDGPTFEFNPLPSGVPDANSVHLVVERELGYQRGDWEEVLVGAPGERSLLSLAATAAPGEVPLARFRFRHAYPWGVRSFPSSPVKLLLGDAGDSELVERWLGEAFVDLVHPDFERRLTARGVLESLGERALPRLEAALRSTDPELASAARDILVAAASEAGGHVELLLRARAIGEGIEVPAPEGAFDPFPGRRAWAMLRAWSASADDPEAREGVEQWRRVAALADPDEGVALLAGMLERAAAYAQTSIAVGEPFVLSPPDARAVPPRPEWRWLFLESDPRQLVSIVRGAVDPGRIEPALMLLRAANEIEALGNERWSNLPGEAERLELALRLIDRAALDDDDTLLVAADRLLGDPGANLAARRELLALRLDNPATNSVERRRVVLHEPRFSELQAQLESLFSEGASYVDVVLPAGEYLPERGLESSWIEVRIPGLRLIGDGQVRLGAGIRLQEVRDVVLEGLRIENLRGSALLLTQSNALVRDCTLIGAQTTVMVDRSDLEFQRVECANQPEHRGAQWSARLLGRSRLLASASLFSAGTLANGPESELYLDRCVVDAEGRSAIQGQRSDKVVLRDCLIRSQVVGLVGIGGGLAVGVVFDTGREPLARGPVGIRVCPELHAVTGSTPPVDPSALLDRCPLDRRPR